MDAFVGIRTLVVRQIQAELRADAAGYRLAAEKRRAEAPRRPEERARGLRWLTSRVGAAAWRGLP